MLLSYCYYCIQKYTAILSKKTLFKICSLRRTQCRQRHPRKNGDNRNYHEQSNPREMKQIVRTFINSRLFFILHFPSISISTNTSNLNQPILQFIYFYYYPSCHRQSFLTFIALSYYHISENCSKIFYEKGTYIYVILMDNIMLIILMQKKECHFLFKSKR